MREPSPQVRVQQSIEQSAPAPGARLLGWAMVAEWSTPGGEKALTRLASLDMPLWEFKGFMHEGLYGAWAGLDAGWEGNGE